MSAETRFVPRTKLWAPEGGARGYIVLECVCGVAIPYPGHPDAATVAVCVECGRAYECVEPERVPVAGGES